MSTPRILLNGRPVIEYLVIHHSAGWERKDISDKKLSKEFSIEGFKNYKKYGYNYKTGYSPEYGQNTLKDPYTGEITYANYHYALHPYKKDGNAYGYRLVQLVDDVLNSVTGAETNAVVTRRAISVCVCGNYMNKYLDNKGLQLLAKKLQWLMKYTKNGIKIRGHRDIESTKCPGDKLYEQIHALKTLLSVIFWGRE